jgi:hypothetical protein
MLPLVVAKPPKANASIRFMEMLPEDNEYLRDSVNWDVIWQAPQGGFRDATSKSPVKRPGHCLTIIPVQFVIPDQTTEVVTVVVSAEVEAKHEIIFRCPHSTVQE